jgi:hypothetical protein
MPQNWTCMVVDATTTTCVVDTFAPIATSTSFVSNLGDISFGIAILIGISSLALIGFAFNSLNSRKKAWQR